MDHPNIVKIQDMGTFDPQGGKMAGDGPAVREYFENGGKVTLKLTLKLQKPNPNPNRNRNPDTVIP